jgi:Zn-dependent protease with chaperone function
VTPSFVLPSAAALLAAMTAGVVGRRLPPAFATRLLTATIVSAAIAAVAATTAVAAAYLAQLPGLARALGWCHAVVSYHDRIPPELGMSAVVVLGLMSASAARAVIRRRRAIRPPAPPNGVEIIASDEPTAFAVPGHPGHVVVSVGMIRRLDPDERRVLFAHEEAHLLHNHHRFLALAQLAAATVPLLRPLLHQVVYNTERWADEVAAVRVGDRHLVARAIAKAALAGQPNQAALAFIGTGVVARVEALLCGRPQARWLVVTTATLLVGLLVTSATGSGVQIHHLAAFVSHLCD